MEVRLRIKYPSDQGFEFLTKVYRYGANCPSIKDNIHTILNKWVWKLGIKLKRKLVVNAINALYHAHNSLPLSSSSLTLKLDSDSFSKNMAKEHAHTLKLEPLFENAFPQVKIVKRFILGIKRKH